MRRASPTSPTSPFPDRTSTGAAPVTARSAPRRSWPVGLRLVVVFVVFLGVMLATNLVPALAGDHAVAALLLGGLCAVGAVALYRLLVRRLEGRPATELAVEDAARGVSGGTLLGMGLFAVVVVVLAALGEYRVAGFGSIGGALATLGLMVSVGVGEELLFRGVVFRLVEELGGTWLALAVSALVFGGLHLVNPHATLVGALSIAVEAGLMLGATYAATRSLWLPIGLHLGWNLAEGGIFGTTVSGDGGHVASLLIGSVTGPTSLTGGTFGPEAGLPAVVVCSALTAVMLVTARRRGQILTRSRARGLRSATPVAAGSLGQ